MMKNSSVFIILLLLLSCSTQRMYTSPEPSLFSTDILISQNENFEVEIQFIKTIYDNYEFEIGIKNKSNDSIFVDSSMFRYVSLSNRKETTQQPVYCINRKEKIQQLNIAKDSLMKEKNPYSLANKSTKGIVKEGLVSGTIAVIFGQDPEKYEEQREDNESEWEQKHQFNLNLVNSELLYWNNKTSFPYNIPPNSELRGTVSFPIPKEIKEIDMEIPVCKDVFNFQFTRLD